MIKNILIYIAGIITGVILIVLAAKITSDESSITLFEEEGECISNKPFEVLQVLDNGDALANEMEIKFSSLLPTGLIVLFRHNDSTSYYDDQVIKIPAGKCAKQVGIFKYESKSGFEKTVPIVEIRDR